MCILTWCNVSGLWSWLLSRLSLRHLWIEGLSLRRHLPIFAISLVEALWVLRLLVRRLSGLLLVKSVLSLSLVQLIGHLVIILRALGLILKLLPLSLLKEVWLRHLTRHHLGGLLLGLPWLVDILHFVIAGKIALASLNLSVHGIWLSSWATHILTLLALHLLNYAVHKFTGVLKPHELFLEALVVRA